jgi:hypothetical protein
MLQNCRSSVNIFSKRLVKSNKNNTSNIRLFTNSIIRNGGHGHDDHGHDDDHHHHGPMMPPFARLEPPKGKLTEEIELVWDDTVAPETCIDFDAPHVESNEMFGMMVAAFGFFGTLYLLVSLSDPEGSNPVAKRATVIPHNMMRGALGITSGDEEEEEEEEEDDDE